MNALRFLKIRGKEEAVRLYPEHAEIIETADKADKSGKVFTLDIGDGYPVDIHVKTKEYDSK